MKDFIYSKCNYWTKSMALCENMLLGMGRDEYFNLTLPSVTIPALSSLTSLQRSDSGSFVSVVLVVRKTVPPTFNFTQSVDLLSCCVLLRTLMLEALLLLPLLQQTLLV